MKRVIADPGPVDDFSAQFRHAGDRLDLIARIKKARGAVLHLPSEVLSLIEIGRAAKKNYAQRLSDAIASKTADALRDDFPGIVPSEDGKGHESRTTGAGGLKKIDVNYSTREHGLGLAVSIKTVNFKDEDSGRYTKNTKRVDAELRAEAQDVHERQRYAVLVGYVFLPRDAAEDANQSNSSLKHLAEVVEFRAGRARPDDDSSKIELAFIGLYEDSGQIQFVDPASVPERGMPSRVLNFSETLTLVREAYFSRNPKARKATRRG